MTPITIKEPFELRALLATMKSAKEKGVGMSIWDKDIKAVADAISVIEAIRARPTQPPLLRDRSGTVNTEALKL